MSRVEHRLVLWPGSSTEVPFVAPDLDTARKMAEPWADEEHEIQSRTVTGWRRAFLPPVEPTCEHCTVGRTFGLAWPDDHRVVAGQRVTAAGHVPDPVVHAADCPSLRADDDPTQRQKKGPDA